jgi:hypothetical protein
MMFTNTCLLRTGKFAGFSRYLRFGPSLTGQQEFTPVTSQCPTAIWTLTEPQTPIAMHALHKTPPLHPIPSPPHPLPSLSPTSSTDKTPPS